MAYKFSQKVQNGSLFKKAIFKISIETAFMYNNSSIIFTTNFVEDMQDKYFLNRELFLFQ